MFFSYYDTTFMQLLLHLHAVYGIYKSLSDQFNALLVSMLCIYIIVVVFVCFFLTSTKIGLFCLGVDADKPTTETCGTPEIKPEVIDGGEVQPTENESTAITDNDKVSLKVLS